MKILKPANIYSSPKYYPGLKAGNTIYTAGRVPVDIDGSVYAPNDPKAQTRQIMECLQIILAEGGATLNDVVYIHTYYLYEEDMAAIFEVYREFFGDHKPPHTGSRQDSKSWVEKGFRLEVEVTAVLEE